MKRKAASEQADAPLKRTPRQDPVSCDLCRRKKLKCNRQQPCSSCTTRQLPCSYGVSSDRGQTTGGETAVPDRIQNVNPLPAARQVDGQTSRARNESVITADWLEKIVMGDRVPTGMQATRRCLNDHQKDVLSPEQRAVTGAALSKWGDWTASSENPATVQLLSFLPKKTEAMALFQYYNDYIDYLYHIILPDRVEEQINAIYQAIENQVPLNLNHLALLFSIIASSLFLQLSIESSAYAELCSQEYTFLTGATLIQSNYSAYPTVEGLQATLIVAHNLSNMNSHPTVSALFVHGAIISQAKSLMLHLIDSPRWERKANGADMMEVELKRRLWWDLASYDWLLGFLSGPQEYTYLIHPDHMHVREPANMDDTIPTGRLPTSIPTKMSYALERLKLAVVCREIVDHLQGEVSYETILKLDRELHKAYSDLPPFFRLDSVSRNQHASLYQERPAIAWQRCLLHQGYHSRLCRLHRQYLIQGARDPMYSYSHVVCLQSARKVLEVKRIMDEDEPTFMPPSSVVWSVMHHVFMAAVILLMDVCFNWDDILAKKRKEEVLDACRMLSKAQESSSTVREGINAMMGVLQKHWKAANGKQSGAMPSAVINPVALDTQTTSSHALPATDVKSSPMDLPSNAMGNDTGDTLEDIWTEMLDRSGDLALDTPDWTGLLTELTDATVPY